ncbi:hypothetical protein [Peteryoungia ipomoeae]|uniref:hypothetical protein n=1 Tax=Peteryoungia ipomoeae TaxID=1210932 RepID=UPI001456293B|nr:hypothetical protein [Peteryoungia ipomoeae]
METMPIRVVFTARDSATRAAFAQAIHPLRIARWSCLTPEQLSDLLLKKNVMRHH